MVNGLQAYYDAYTNADAAYLSAVPTLTDLGPNGWDAEQSVGGSQAKMLPWGQAGNYLHQPNVTANHCTTEVLSLFAGATSVEIASRLSGVAGLAVGTSVILERRGSSNQRVAGLLLRSSGILTFSASTDGTTAGGTSVDSTAAIPSAGPFGLWVKCTWSGATGDVEFFVSQDATKNESEVTWTKLGSTVSFITGSIWGTPSWDGTSVGSRRSGQEGRFTGEVIYYASAFDGTTKVTFDASRGNSNSDTIDSETGETWTINRSGANPARIVSAPAWLLDGTDDFWALPSAALGMLRNVPGATVVAVVNQTDSFSVRRILTVIGGSGLVRVSLASNGLTLRLQARRLDADTIAALDVGSGVILNATRSVGTVVNWSQARATLNVNGAAVGTADPFLTAGNSDDTQSNAAFIGRLDVTGNYFPGTIERLAIYNRALSDAEIRALSRYFANRARAGITI
jgi:hypothetical protein